MEDKQIFIPKDSLVKIYFKNGTIIEGIVIVWSDKKGLLRSPGSQNRMIIYNPVDNVMMIKLLAEEENIETQETNEEPIIKSATLNESEELEVEVESEDLQEDESEDDSEEEIQGPLSIADRTKKLVKYRLSQAAQDKKNIAETLSRAALTKNPPLNLNKQTPEVEVTYYEPPNFTKRRPIVST